MACQFQSVASTAPFLVDAFAIDFARFGTLIGLYMLPGIFISVPGGMLGQRFGAKNLVLAGLLLMALGGVLMGASTSFLPVMAGRLVSGVGAVLINVLVTKMVTDWFVGREIVTAMAILVVSWPLGLALELLLFTPLAASLSWNAVMYTAALMALASFLLVALMYSNASETSVASASGLNLTLTRREWLCVSLAGSIWMTYNVGYIVLISFLPALFTTRGYSLSQAGLVVSFLGWIADTLSTVSWYSCRTAKLAKRFLSRRPFDRRLSCRGAANRTRPDHSVRGSGGGSWCAGGTNHGVTCASIAARKSRRRNGRVFHLVLRGHGRLAGASWHGPRFDSKSRRAGVFCIWDDGPCNRRIGGISPRQPIASAARVISKGRRQCPLLAQSGHRQVHCTCPLSGVKRTCLFAADIGIGGQNVR